MPHPCIDMWHLLSFFWLTFICMTVSRSEVGEKEGTIRFQVSLKNAFQGRPWQSSHSSFTFQYRGCGFNPSSWVAPKTETKTRSDIVTSSIKTLNMAHIKTALKKCIPIYIRGKYCPISLIQGTRTSSIQSHKMHWKTPGTAGGVMWSWCKQDRVSAQEGEQLRRRMAVRGAQWCERILCPWTAQLNMVETVCFILYDFHHNKKYF